MPSSITLLIIAPQNYFCDIAGAVLPVSGTHADMQRVAGNGLCAIRVTLDSHSPVDIAHPAWWRNTGGRLPIALYGDFSGRCGGRQRTLAVDALGADNEY